jgi:DNA-directed RNA polymerase specialized sigma24 family protein
MPSSSGSVTHWLGLLRAGDGVAAQPLWEGYFRRLVGLARARLQGVPRRAADEEDVALSAFDSFCRGARAGRFPRLADRDDLRQVLVLLTARRAGRLRKHERRQKRGGGRVQTEADLAGGEPDAEAALAEVVGREPTPDFAAQLAEECRRLLDLLKEDDLRAIALAKMEGHGHEEIAERLGCAPRTVQRKLGRIRSLWSREVPS